MTIDASLLDRIRSAGLDTEEAGALMRQYLDGQCMPFAFAMHWLTGWKVEALGEIDSENFLHFAAVAPDGAIWDASGPRSRREVDREYCVNGVWQIVDPHKYCFSDTAAVTEDDINEACVAAIRLFGPQLDRHILRTPVIPENLLPQQMAVP
jgi:hypothetical protein